jgi:hypothetical protein
LENQNTTVVKVDTTELTWSQASIKLFDKIKVLISIEEASVAAAQRSKLVLRLVEPVIPGLSVIKEEVITSPNKKQKL